MTQIKKVLIPILFVLITSTLLIVFRSVPVSRLWNNYSVLYCPVDSDINTINTVLDKYNCKDVISIFNQRIPLYSKIVPIKSIENDSYINERNNYFYDKSKEYLVFYVNDHYRSSLEKAVKTLRTDYKINANLDGKATFPWLTPIICTVLALFFAFISKNKIAYLLQVLVPVLFSYCLPFYINASSVSLFLYSIFLEQKILNRKDNISYILTNPYILVFTILPIILSFMSSFLSGIMFLLSAISSVIVFYLLELYKTYSDSKLHFCPVNIRPAKYMNIINNKTVRAMLYCSFAIVFMIISSIFSFDSSTSSNSTSKQVLLPIPSSKENVLPNMNSYINWVWNTLTMPYRNLNEPYSGTPEENEVVVIPRFEQTSEGIITSNQEVFCFDTKFKNSAVEEIDNLEYSALEKLFKKQGSNFSASYGTGNEEKISSKTLIILFLELLIPLIMTFYYLLKRKKGGYVL